MVLAERDVEGLDPHVSGALWQTQTVLSNAYEGLVGSDPHLALVPALALSWSSPDERTFEFRLRSGVRFHDGRPLEVEDVVFSLERARDHPGSTLKSALSNVSEVRAVGPDSLRLHTREPDVFFLSKLKDAFIASRACVAEHEARGFGAASCGSGPYRIASRRPGDSVDLERFDEYWRGPAEIRALRFVARGYGDRDALGFVPPGARLMFAWTPGLQLPATARRELVPHRSEGLTVSYLGFDLRERPSPGVRLTGAQRGNPFRDPQVRAAIDLAIRRGRLREQAERDGSVATQAVAPGVFGFDPAISTPREAAGEARRVMDATRFREGFEVDLDIRKLMEAYGPPLAEDLAAVGIRARVNVLADEAFFAKLQRGESSLYVLRFTCRTGVAQEYLEKWVHSRDDVRGLGVFNFSYETDPVPDLDAQIEGVARLLWRSAQRDRLQAILRRVTRERLSLPLLQKWNVTFASRDVAWTPRADNYRLGFDARVVPEAAVPGDARLWADFLAHEGVSRSR